MNKQYKSVVFDLDGTLVDSATTIYESAIRTLDELGIERSRFTRGELDKRIGAHFQDMFDELGVGVTDFDEFITLYKKFYNELLTTSTLYPGVKEVLGTLFEHDIKIALLTTKAQDQAEHILEFFGIAQFFTNITGRKDGIPHKPHPEALLIISRELNLNPNEMLMVGDTEYDVECGHNAGSATCAVTYGYRDKTYLEELKPTYIANSLQDVLSFVLNKR